MTELLVRADGGPGIGAGHLMRCLSLSQAAAARGWRSHLAVSRATDLPPAWSALAASVSVLGNPAGSPADLEATAGLADQLGAAWVVADHYAFDTALLDCLGERVPHLLLIDDQGERDAAVTLAVNPNPGADAQFAQRYARARRALLGPDYFLLRGGIAAAVASPHEGRVLVSFGGDDEGNLALDFVHGVIAAGIPLDADVICTAPGDGLARLRAATIAAPGDWRIHPGPVELAPLLASACVLVCGGGGTASEAAFLGVPGVIVVRADNQRPGARALADQGAAIVAGEGGAALPQAVQAMRRLLESATLRAQMARAGRQLVDGAGARRVVEAMSNIG